MTISPTTSTLGSGTVGTSYTPVTISATGGVPPYTYTVTSGSLPTGLFLNPTSGVISGTPILAGVYNFVITATDSDGCTASMAYTIIVNCPSITISPTTSALTSGTVGTTYTSTISAAGGVAPYTYSVTSGRFPPGLILNPLTGVISGVPTLAGTYEFLVTVTDRDGCMGAMAYTLIVNCPGITLTPTTSALASGTTGTAYTQTISASGGVAPYTYAVTSGSLPTGLLLDPLTGVISGTPTQAGFYNFIITATDSDGCMAAMAYSITINCPSITFNTASPLTPGTVGTAYTQTISVSGGVAPLTFSVTGGALPPGLFLDTTTGVISGIPTLAGVYNFVITVTDRDGCSASMPYSLVINCPTVTITTTSPLASGTVGTPYTQTIAVSGGVAPYTFSVTSGMLPPGLYLNPLTGVISGDPTSAGIYDFVIGVTDRDGCTAYMTYTLIVNCPSITFNTASPLPSATVDAFYTQTISVSGGVAPLTYSVTSGTLPPGLILNPTTGVISGVPTLAATYDFLITVTDRDGCSASMAYTLIVNCPTVTINTSTLPNGTTDVLYNQTISVSGGTAPYTFSVSSGTLPPGLLLNSTTGVISGYPVAAGVYHFVISVSDGTNCTVAMAYTIIINCPTITINTASPLPSGTAGAIYSETISVTGGVAPLTFSVTGGALPPGLLLNPATGVISGIPIMAGVYHFDITVTDSDGCSAAMAYILVINCPGITITTPSPLPSGTAGSSPPYSQQIMVTGGVPPYVFSVISGSLPPGLLLNPTTGVISGIPITAGVYHFVISVTDSDGCMAAMSYTLIINCPSITFNTPSPLPSGTAGFPYTPVGISVTGGVPPLTYNVSSGSFPPGLYLNPLTGVISGIPTLAGSYEFLITVTDSDGCMASMPYILIINCPTITITTTSPLPDGTTGTPYFETIMVSGGAAPLTFSVTNGMLPPGLILSPSTGVISGIPIAPGTYDFVVTVTDRDGCSASMAYVLIVSCPDITISPATLPNGVTGVAYSATVSASGGSQPYTFTVTTGILPPGLLLDPLTGLISGIPTKSGVYNFIVTATDSYGCKGAISYTIIITCSDITITTTSPLPTGTLGTVYSETIMATGTLQPFTFTVTSGMLPPGLILDPTTGIISGVPTKAGVYSFVITVTNTDGCSVSKSFLLQIVCPTITVTPSTLPNGSLGVAYPASSGTLTASGGLAPYTFRVSAGMLPPGLLLATTGPSTAVIFGVPEEVGSFSFEITTTDSLGCSVTDPYIITISCPTGTIGALSDNWNGGSPLHVRILPHNCQRGLFVYYTISSGSLPPGLVLSGDRLSS